MTNSAYVQVFSTARLVWDSILVQKMQLDYFKGKLQDYPTWSKLVQINNNQIILVGGDHSFPSLLTHWYDVGRSCLLVDLSSGIVAEKA